MASSRQPPRLYLLVCRNKTQELVHVAHKQPVGVEFHRGLHPLGSEEVLQGLVHLLALGTAHTGVEECYEGSGGAQHGGTGGLAKGSGKGLGSLGCLYYVP